MPFRVAILTVSDTACNKGLEYDLSGPLLKQKVDQNPEYALADTAIVPDDIALIREQVKEWVDRKGQDKVDWVITTGGTGFGERDVTPQALSPYISPLPGLLQYLTTFFLSKTPRAVLSRTVVGLYDRTLVLCLPGSQKACQEGWEAMTDGAMTSVVAHGLKQLQGGSGEDIHPPRETVKQGNATAHTVSAGLDTVQDQALQGYPAEHSGCGHRHRHEAPESQGDRDHHHHHHHHRHHHKQGALSKDPSAAVSGRLRQSPFPLISLKEALAIVDAESKPLPVETVKTGHKLKNYVLAEDVLSATDLPVTRTTAVDGYAVVADSFNRAARGVKSVEGLVARVAKGRDEQQDSNDEKLLVYRINTGGPLPSGTDSVIMVEDTELVSGEYRSDDGQEFEIRILLEKVPVGDNVRQPGSDARKGERVLEKGTVIGSGGGEVGLLGFVGKREVLVHRRPVVALLSTGNELVELEQSATESESDTWTGVVDTNRPSLKATLEGLGYDVVDVGIAPDTMDLQEAALRKGLAMADMLITTGGTSMGEADLLKPLIEHRLGATTFATIPPTETGGQSKIIFALPGNPASALVTFYLFALPSLRALGGWPTERRHLPRIGVEVDRDMKLDAREEFHRVIVSPSRDRPGVLVATSTGGQQSSRVASLCGANGLVHLPLLEAGGKNKVSKGDIVNAVIIGEIRG